MGGVGGAVGASAGRVRVDELFSGQPNMGAVKQMPPASSLPDISLMTFLRRQRPAIAADLLESPRVPERCVDLQLPGLARRADQLQRQR